MPHKLLHYLLLETVNLNVVSNSFKLNSLINIHRRKKSLVFFLYLGLMLLTGDSHKGFLTHLTGQSDRDTSNSLTSQDSQQGEPSAPEPIAMETPDLMTAHCGLLTNLLAILPDFTLTALRHNQLLQVLAR